MVVDSVVTAILCRDDDSDHFALDSTQRTLAIHKLSIELEMMAHRPTMNAVDPKDVVLICNLIFFRYLVPGQKVDKCHCRLTAPPKQVQPGQTIS